MSEEEKPMLRLMKLAGHYKGIYVLSVVSAVLGVAAGMIPFFAVSEIAVLLIEGEEKVSVYMKDSAL